ALERVPSQWRGLDLGTAEKAATHRTKSISTLMPKVLKEMGLDQRRIEAEILKVCNHLISPEIVAHAQPTGLHKATLFVAVDNNVWLSEIVRYRRKEILDRMQHSFGREFFKRIS